MVRGVLFDVDGTLYHQLPVRAAMTMEMALHGVVTASPLALRRQARTLLAFRHVREELRALGRPDAALDELQFARTAERTGVSPADVRRLVEDWMFRRPLKYVRHARRRDVVAMIPALEQRGLLIGAVSDYPAAAKLAALGLERAFSVALCTTDAEINAFKPHPRGLLRACELWGLAPEDVVYVGDRAEVDCAAAQAAGMRSYLVTRVNTGQAAEVEPHRQQKDGQYVSRGLQELQQDCRTAA